MEAVKHEGTDNYYSVIFSDKEIRKYVESVDELTYNSRVLNDLVDVALQLIEDKFDRRIVDECEAEEIYYELDVIPFDDMSLRLDFRLDDEALDIDPYYCQYNVLPDSYYRTPDPDERDGDMFFEFESMDALLGAVSRLDDTFVQAHNAKLYVERKAEGNIYYLYVCEIDKADSNLQFLKEFSVQYYNDEVTERMYICATRENVSFMYENALSVLKALV